jgi:hypothetical protein
MGNAGIRYSRSFQSHCCEDLVDRITCGGCNVHARNCSADTGIFLKIRECKVVVLSEIKRGEVMDKLQLTGRNLG